MEHARRSKIVRIDRNHPYYRTSNKGNISEARLIMATHLNRNLVSDEIVYHKDSDPDNNTIENLVVLSRKQASLLSLRKRVIDRIEREKAELSWIDRLLSESGVDIDTQSRDESRYREVDRDAEVARKYKKSRNDESEAYD